MMAPGTPGLASGVAPFPPEAPAMSGASKTPRYSTHGANFQHIRPLSALVVDPMSCAAASTSFSVQG